MNEPIEKLFELFVLQFQNHRKHTDWDLNPYVRAYFFWFVA